MWISGWEPRPTCCEYYLDARKFENSNVDTPGTIISVKNTILNGKATINLTYTEHRN